jgi:hypothetical protein
MTHHGSEPTGTVPDASSFTGEVQRGRDVNVVFEKPTSRSWRT